MSQAASKFPALAPAGADAHVQGQQLVPVPAEGGHLVEVLSPQELGARAKQAVDEILLSGSNPNTRRSYDGAARYWAAWYMLRYPMQPKLSLPVPVPVVLQFLVDHLARRAAGAAAGEQKQELPVEVDRQLVDAGFKGALGPLAISSCKHRLAVLSRMHSLRQVAGEEVANPVADARVREIMRAARRAAGERRDKPKKMTPLTLDLLDALLAQCAGSSLIDCRDRALILLGWSSGGRRRSEIAEADMDRLEEVSPKRYLLNLGRTKTNQEADEDAVYRKPIEGRAGEALSEWLRRSGIREGAVFRSVRGQTVGDCNLTGQAVFDIVRKLADRAGLVGNWGGHSLRRGFITEAVRKGVPRPDIMSMTEQRDERTVAGYEQANKLSGSKVATLAG